MSLSQSAGGEAVAHPSSNDEPRTPTSRPLRRVDSISRRYSKVALKGPSPRNSGSSTDSTNSISRRFSALSTDNLGRASTDELNVASYVSRAVPVVQCDFVLAHFRAPPFRSCSSFCGLQVPSRVIRYFEKLVEEGKSPPEAEHAVPISSILLVADISGFTKLSKYLLETKGKDGPDLTSQ